MNTRYVLTAIAAALIAAGESLQIHAADYTGDDTGSTDSMDEPVGEAVVTDGAVDSSGLPWHPAIHSSSKKQKADGTWNRRKGVQDVEFNRVAAELRALAAAGTPAPAAAPVAAPTPGPAIKLPGAAPSITLAPPTPYAQLCAWLAANSGEGKPLSTEQVESAFKENGTTLAALAADQEASTAWLNAFKAAVGAA
jgi:hypothetical protein